jgi:hypothetical protein
MGRAGTQEALNGINDDMLDIMIFALLLDPDYFASLFYVELATTAKKSIGFDYQLW